MHLFVAFSPLMVRTSGVCFPQRLRFLGRSSISAYIVLAETSQYELVLERSRKTTALAAELETGDTSPNCA